MVAALVMLLCIGWVSRAQEVIYSPYQNFDFRSGEFSVVGKVNGVLYMYRGTPQACYLDAYNDQMERTATVVLDFFTGKIYDTKFITYQNQMIVLYQSVESGKVTLYAALLDDKGRLLKRPVVIDAAKQAFFGSYRSYFKIAVSEDKKKILAYETTQRNKSVNADCTWLDDQLTILSKCHTSFNTDNDLEVGEGLVHNDGTFFLPVYTPLGNRNYADQVWLLVLPQAEKKFTPKELPLNNMFAAGTYMKLDNTNDRIYIAGFYSDKKNGSFEGVLYNYYNLKTGTYEPTRLIPLDEELRNNSGERNKKRAFNDYQVKNLIVKNDGGFVLVAEDFFISTRNSYNPGFGYYSFYSPTMSSSVREYHYNDIMSLAYDAEGKRQWKAFVRKEQYSQEDGGMFSSYAMVNTGGALGYLFNDFNSTRSRVQLASVDDEGKVSMMSLNTGADIDWLPRSGKQVSAHEIVVPCLHKRQICFAKIVF